jgi:hypothetical protein
VWVFRFDSVVGVPDFAIRRSQLAIIAQNQRAGIDDDEPNSFIVEPLGVATSSIEGNVLSHLWKFCVVVRTVNGHVVEEARCELGSSVHFDAVAHIVVNDDSLWGQWIDAVFSKPFCQVDGTTARKDVVANVHGSLSYVCE